MSEHFSDCRPLEKREPLHDDLEHTIQKIADFSGLAPRRVLELAKLLKIDVEVRCCSHVLDLQSKSPKEEIIITNTSISFQIIEKETYKPISTILLQRICSLSSLFCITFMFSASLGELSLRDYLNLQLQHKMPIFFEKGLTFQYLKQEKAIYGPYKYSDLVITTLIEVSKQHGTPNVPITSIFADGASYTDYSEMAVVGTNDAFLLTLGLSPNLPKKYFDSLLQNQPMVRRHKFFTGNSQMSIKSWLAQLKKTKHFYKNIPSFYQALKLPPEAKVATNQIRQEARKLETKKRHQAWKKEYRRLKRNSPDKSDPWIADKISKMGVAEGRKAGTIRRNMK